MTNAITNTNTPTNFSMKKFIEKNYTGKYDFDELKSIASRITTESADRYTDESALKLLCRYAYVQKNKIMFNVDGRDSEQTLASLEAKLKASKTQKQDLINNDNDDEVVEIPKKVIAVKKRGFGSTASMKGIIKSGSDNNDEQIKSKTKLDTKSSTKLKPDTKSSTKPDTKSSTKPVVKKGGFGVFNKSVITNGSSKTSNTSNRYSNKKTSDNKGDQYQYPVEKRYAGNIRNDTKYGPYGTDNYHDDDLHDDEITDDLQDRIMIYRKLECKYYPAQRTEEWFDLRDKLTTASDGGAVVELNPYDANYSFISKKVHGKPFETSEDCYHGKKHEQNATMVYEYRMNVKVKEFGLCQHPKYDFLGASPDGIVSEYKLKTKDGRSWADINEELELIEDWDDKRSFMAEHGIKTKYVGRMLEIKCPMRRKIKMEPEAIQRFMEFMGRKSPIF